MVDWTPAQASIDNVQDNDLERDFAVHRTEADYDAAEARY